jgi:N-acetylneuraminate lyase
MFPVSGLIPATFTPMHPDGSLNLDRIPAIVDRMVKYKLGGLYVCGSTGEGPLLTTEERKAVAEAYVKAAAGRIPVIIQTGHASNWESRGLAAHAAAIGADAISALPPIYFKPDSLEMLIRCLQEVTAGAPDTPFYYYHIPPLTSVSFDMRAFLRQAAEAIPSLAGIKFSSHVIPELQGCIDEVKGKYQVLFGVDDAIVSGHAVGASGGVGSTYNYMAPIYQTALAAYEAGDNARAFALQGEAARVVDIMVQAKHMAGLKAMMKMIGIDCGPCRLPLHTLNEQEYNTLKAALDAEGFFEKWAMM